MREKDIINKAKGFVVNFYHTYNGKVVQILGNDGTTFTHRTTQKGAIKFIWDNKLVPPNAEFVSLTRRYDWEHGKYGRVQPLENLGLSSKHY